MRGGSVNIKELAELVLRSEKNFMGSGDVYAFSEVKKFATALLALHADAERLADSLMYCINELDGPYHNSAEEALTQHRQLMEKL